MNLHARRLILARWHGQPRDPRFGPALLWSLIRHRIIGPGACPRSIAHNKTSSRYNAREHDETENRPLPRGTSSSGTDRVVSQNGLAAAPSPPTNRI